MFMDRKEQPVMENYKKEFIEFMSYARSGNPAFADFRNGGITGGPFYRVFAAG